MSLFRLFPKRFSSSVVEVSPDEIFMDSANVPNFDQEGGEGIAERVLSRKTFSILGIVLGIVAVGICARLIQLQIFQGQHFFTLAEENRIFRVPIFSERGIIYDRNGYALASNEVPRDGEPFSRRKYIDMSGFGHVLGYVSYPKKDKKGFYWQDMILGKEGIEALYAERLTGKQGALLLETDAQLTVSSTERVEEPIHGENITLALDASMQAALHEGIQQMIAQFGYQAGAGIIMDVRTGELRVLTSAPEYSSSILSEGVETSLIQEYLSSTKGYFINRALSGLYSPGSIVKPFVAYAALEEGLIDATTRIMSTGAIRIPNPYFPDKPSIFRDWKPSGHGSTDVTWALADSVNTFFYAISGGYQDQVGLGIDRMINYFNLFKIGQKTGITLPGEAIGIIPSPKWKRKVFDEPWRLGDTYITAIGQFGFQVTPIQMVRAIGAVANNGYLVKPKVLDTEPTEIVVIQSADQESFELVRAGMRRVVTEGIGRSNLYRNDLAIAAKTGTAQVGSGRQLVNSWAVGFYPYENPEYAFTVVMERGPAQGTINASWAMKYMFDHMAEYTAKLEAGKEGQQEVIEMEEIQDSSMIEEGVAVDEGNEEDTTIQNI